MRGLRGFSSRPEPSRRRLRTKALCALVFCAVAACGAGVAAAQSGRRQAPPRSPVPPAATPTPAPDSSDSSSSGGYSDSDARRRPQTSTGADTVVSFIVFEDDSSSHFLNLPASTAAIVVNSFARRLGDASGVSVSSGGRSDRRRAREHAKTEKSAYTILLQVDEQMQGAGGSTDLSNLIVRYFVYEPSSATLKHQGQVYMRPYQPTRRVGGVNLPLPMPTSRRVPVEYIFEQAGRDAADRVLAAFHLRPPD